MRRLEEAQGGQQQLADLRRRRGVVGRRVEGLVVLVEGLLGRRGRQAGVAPEAAARGGLRQCAAAAGGVLLTCALLLLGCTLAALALVRRDVAEVQVARVAAGLVVVAPRLVVGAVRVL